VQTVGIKSPPGVQFRSGALATSISERIRPLIFLPAVGGRGDIFSNPGHLVAAEPIGWLLSSTGQLLCIAMLAGWRTVDVACSE